MDFVFGLTALAALSLVVWFWVMSSFPAPLESEGLADAAEDEAAAIADGPRSDPVVRRTQRVRAGQAAARQHDASLARADDAAAVLPVVRRLLVRTGAGPMRVTVSGSMPSEAPFCLLTVSNPGADTHACYGPFLASAAAAIPALRRAAVVSIDLPGQESHAEEFEPEGGLERAPLPDAPPLVSFSSLAEAVVDCCAAVRVGEAVGLGAGAGAWLLLAAQARRPALLRAFVACGITAVAPRLGEASTLAALAWWLSSPAGWTPWSRRLVAGGLMSTTAARGELGRRVREGTRDWNPKWVAALLAGWSARPALLDSTLEAAVLGCESVGHGRKGRGGASALSAVVLMQPAVPGIGIPLCDGSPPPSDTDALAPRLSKLFGDKGLGGACSHMDAPGGPLSASEVPHRTIRPLKCLLLGFGIAVDD
ncbi:hypothetical protein FNF31_06029 [Cafeteria roenbergensis]|uniref:Uncharacterized protein n=1 Tax=Cafeteria roenbergensis TaxID=33653 RepID=A0A5A8CTI4_CAFRO|nr:hypothetical protein FNF31_06029 [Cafeteria roenbergensis]